MNTPRYQCVTEGCSLGDCPNCQAVAELRRANVATPITMTTVETRGRVTESSRVSEAEFGPTPALNDNRRVFTIRVQSYWESIGSPPGVCQQGDILGLQLGVFDVTDANSQKIDTVIPVNAIDGYVDFIRDAIAAFRANGTLPPAKAPACSFEITSAGREALEHSAPRRRAAR
jgi:hypothetical protein